MNTTTAERPVVWSIAGHDNAGLAGLAADIKTIHCLDAHPCPIATALTAQNNHLVEAIHPSSAHLLDQQWNTAPAPQAIKIGMLASIEQMAWLSRQLKDQHVPVVWDPVMVTSSGHHLLPDGWLTHLESLLPSVDLITPNWPELSALTGLPVNSSEDVIQAAHQLRIRGAQAVLVTGGHGPGDTARDYFSDSKQSFWLHSPKSDNPNTRGTGCVLSAAIATSLAQGHRLTDAVVIGKMVINQAIDAGLPVAGAQGTLVVNGLHHQEQYLPMLTPTVDWQSTTFPDCADQPLGLYPIVDRAEWLAQLLPLGISTIQLRIKDLTGKALRKEIQQAIAISQKHKARLFINDHWSLAIELGAYGVHLGQEDLEQADLKAIAAAGLRLGISTHCHHEVARAHAIRPSYLACGPVYATTSKNMPWVPQGIPNLKNWIDTMSSYPWVAIGGINHSNISQIAETGTSGIAMISAITQSTEPQKAVQKLLTKSN